MAGRRPACELLDLELEHAGHELAHVADQLVARRRRSGACPSRAPPSSRRARSGRRRAGRGRPARRGSRASTRPGPLGSRRRRTWPLTGRTGTRAASGSAEPRGVHAGGDDDGAGRRRVAPSSSSTPVTRSSSTRTRDRAGAAHVGDLAQRGDEPARVDRVVARDVEREPHGRRQRGLGAARLLGRRRSTARPSDSRKRDQPLERLGLVGVARDDERAAARAGRGRARRLGQLGAERRRTSRRCAGRARAARARRTPPRRPARACRRRRARRRARRASSTTARQAAAGGAPGAREADRPAADDGDVVVLR